MTSDCPTGARTKSPTSECYSSQAGAALRTSLFVNHSDVRSGHVHDEDLVITVAVGDKENLLIVRRLCGWVVISGVLRRVANRAVLEIEHETLTVPKTLEQEQRALRVSEPGEVAVLPLRMTRRSLLASFSTFTPRS